MSNPSKSWCAPPVAWQHFLPRWCVDGANGPSVLVDRMVEAEGRGALCPPMADLWRALECTPPEEVKVVLLGQDPYHGMRQAHGLAFSVSDPLLPWPPSLRNVFKERASDLGVPLDRSANLEDWAQQGVLLLNAVLTTEMGTAGAHQGLGWEDAVQDMLVGLMARTPSLIWILWGKPAQNTHAKVLNACGAKRDGDTVIASAHPSPLAAYRGFWDSQPFSRCNAALEARGAQPIVW